MKKEHEHINYDKVVDKKRHKYGEHCFEKWGKRGGSPILLAYAERKRKGGK